MNTVTIKITKGSAAGSTYTFAEQDSVYVGRSEDCQIHVRDKTVSRYHCLLDIVPPFISVRDFGSLNGTYVNGKLIGKRNKSLDAAAARKLEFSIIPLFQNDLLSLGKDVQMQIESHSELRCKQCNKIVEIVRDELCDLSADGLLCQSCKEKDQKQQKEQIQEDEGKPSKSPVSLSGYRICKCIGRGGMGEVWLAEDIAANKEVAIKIMLPDFEQNDNSRNVFIREASIAAQLCHQNIVRQHAFINDSNGLCIIMEYCNGGSIESQMRNGRTLIGIKPALDCILQVLDGLSYAHKKSIRVTLANGQTIVANGIVHRDLKPSNIFIQTNDKAIIYKVADFGLSKAFELAGLSGHTKAGQIAGTPFFMPRQQVLDFRYAKPQVDVWAAAASLYFMLTGICPKQGENIDPWLLAVTEKARPILERNSKIPRQLAKVIDYALVDSPALQVATAEELKKMILNIYREVI